VFGSLEKIIRKANCLIRILEKKNLEVMLMTDSSGSFANSILNHFLYSQISKILYEYTTFLFY